MQDWRPLSHRAGGMQTDVLFDSSGQIVFRTQQETQPVLDLNKEKRNSGTGGWFGDRDMRHVASIPLSVMHKWLAEEGFDVLGGELDQGRLARKLNDPDYFYLRTAEGHLGPAGDGTYR